eukprot:4236546-Amphidinium_carterae.2
MMSKYDQKTAEMSSKYCRKTVEMSSKYGQKSAEMCSNCGRKTAKMLSKCDREAYALHQQKLARKRGHGGRTEHGGQPDAWSGGGKARPGMGARGLRTATSSNGKRAAKAAVQEASRETATPALRARANKCFNLSTHAASDTDARASSASSSAITLACLREDGALEPEGSTICSQ